MHIMRIYTEDEVLQMAGPLQLQEWYHHIAKLPNYRRILQKGAIIRLCFYAGMQPIPGMVLKTHIAGEQILYDLEITFPNGSEEKTRVYNISAQYVEEVIFGNSFEIRTWL